MKKVVTIGLAAGAVIAVALLIKKSQTSESPEAREARKAEKRKEMFEKMRAGMESMPEDFPPMVMFNNIAATRENTERILTLLEADEDATGEADEA